MSGSPEDDDHNPFGAGVVQPKKPQDPFDGAVKKKDDPFDSQPEEDEEISENEEGTSDA